MEPLKPAAPYHARPAGTASYRLDQSAYKVYYADIINRPQRERYEWDQSPLTRAWVLQALAAIPLEGVGAVVAFPHITKVFRFAPEAETLMQVRAFWTPDFSPVDLQQAEGYLEFACYAEAIIAADEYRYWAEASSVAQYLQRWSGWSDAPISDSTKLARYFAAKTTNL